MNMTSNTDESKLKDLDKAIKASKKVLERKMAALKKAQAEKAEAESETYKLQSLRDQTYLNGLGDKVDWDMVFNCNSEETTVAFNYRKMIIREHGIKDTGFYNLQTKQHCFCIEFETDGAEELQKQVRITEFIFSKLVPNKDDKNRKCLSINNLIDEDDYESTELAKDAHGKFAILVRRHSRVTIKQEFNTLVDALAHIQSKSNVAFDINESDRPMLTVQG